MSAAKLTEITHWRMTAEMAEAIRILVYLEDRPFPHEVRHLINLALEQERERLLGTKWRPKQVIFVKRFLQLLGED